MENKTHYGGNKEWREMHIPLIGPKAYGQMCDYQRYRRHLWGDANADPCDAPATEVFQTDCGNYAMCDDHYQGERDWWESHCEPRDVDPEADEHHYEAVRDGQ